MDSYRDEEFQSHFRLTKYSFIKLLTMFELQEKSLNGRPQVPLKYQLLMTLWMLGNKEVYRKISDRFNVSKSTARDILYIYLFILKRNLFLKWPTYNEAIQISKHFEVESGFPGIVGAIDGTHIKISKSMENQESYVNRKQYHSLILHGIADHNRKFIDVPCGWPGSMHDARVFRRSEIGHRLATNAENLLPPGCHLVGDSAYPLTNYLMVPFKDNGALTRRERKYNVRLSQKRIVVEHAFALLKGRFKSLQHLHIYNTKLAPKIIFACWLLHNFCIENNDESNIEVIPNNEEDVSANLIITLRERGAAEKRNYISSILS